MCCSGEEMAKKMKCSVCNSQLSGPSGAKNIWCSTCGNMTRIRMRDRARRAITWLKGIVSYVGSPNNGYSIIGTPQPSFEGSNGSYHLTRPLPYPSVYGNKRAVLCGISYRDRSYELQGTVNDVVCMKYLLCQRFGFPESCILMLTEDETDPYRLPTKQNMRMAMRWLVNECQPGDSLVFHYSGHGSQQPDYNGDEVDGYDEILCPLDFETAGSIVDDEINETIVRPIPYGAKIHAIVDACHSGTALDLPYVWRLNKAGVLEWQKESSSVGSYKGTSGGEALSFSSCDDHQTSADTSAFSGSTMTGAMTFAFIQAIETGSAKTYGNLMHAIHSVIRNASVVQGNGPISSLLRRVFRAGLTQEPQLSSSEWFNVYQKPFSL